MSNTSASVVVDLSEYTQSFLYEVNSVGSTTYNPSTDEIVGRLIDSFWECRLDGFLIFQDFTCDDTGLITPQASTPGFPDYWNPYSVQQVAAFPRDYVQLVVLMAGYRALITLMQNTNVSVMAKAGSVESSTQMSPQMFIAALKAVTSKIDIALTRLSDLGSTSVGIRDAVIDNTCAILNDETWFVRGGSSYGSDSWGA